MEFETSRVINSNGQRYRVGWDEHGWFSIRRVAHNPLAEKDMDEPDFVPETDHNGNPYPITSFSHDGARDLIEAIEEGL